MSSMSKSRKKRRKNVNPVDEHRRRVMIQSIVLALLTLIAAFFVYQALTMPT